MRLFENNKKSNIHLSVWCPASGYSFGLAHMWKCHYRAQQQQKQRCQHLRTNTPALIVSASCSRRNASVLGPSVWEPSATAATLVHPNLHVISSNGSKNTCSEYCMSTNTFNIHLIAFILKHNEIKIQHNSECQRSIKNARNSSNRFFPRARLVLSMSVLFVSCWHLSSVSIQICGETELRCLPYCSCSRDVFEMNWIHLFENGYKVRYHRRRRSSNKILTVCTADGCDIDEIW